MAGYPNVPSGGAETAIRLTDTRNARVECRWCGWGDHNTAWHERVEQQAEKP